MELPSCRLPISTSKPFCSADGGRRAVGLRVRQRARHGGGKLVDLCLRLHQHVVAHVEIAGDLTGTDGAGGDQIGGGAARRGQRDGAERAIGRGGAPFRLRVDRGMGIERQRRGLRADELHPGRGRDRDLIVVALDHADVHQLGKLIDVTVALILQPSGRRILLWRAAELQVERGDLLQAVVGLGHVVRQSELRLAAQGLDAGGHLVERLREPLGRADHRDLGRPVARAGRQRLQRGGEIVERALERAGGIRRTVDALQLIVHVGARGRVGGARRLGAQLGLHELVEHAVDGRRPGRRRRRYPVVLATQRRGLAHIARRIAHWRRCPRPATNWSAPRSTRSRLKIVPRSDSCAKASWCLRTPATAIAAC